MSRDTAVVMTFAIMGVMFFLALLGKVIP